MRRVFILVLLSLVAGLSVLSGDAATAAATIYVDDDNCPGPGSGTVGDPYCEIQDAVDGAADGDTVSIAAGLYTGAIEVEGRSDLSIAGVDRDTVIVKPATTLDWGDPYGSSRQVAVRVYDSTTISLSGMTLDFDTVKANFVHGILMWDSTGTLNDNVLKNMSVSDASGGYYEITSYIRAPGYSAIARAAVAVTNNEFVDTGRLGVVTHDFVDATIQGNSFTKVVNDFGYAMEIGSESTATISGNTISGYDTAAASDGSESAGIYVENCFTGNWFGGPGPQIDKPVTISRNDIYGNQYGVWMGCGWDQYAGDVDIAVALRKNEIHDNNEAGVLVEDEDASDGSSVSLAAIANVVENNGAAGYYFNTYGDGELHAELDCETISGHTDGILVEDNAAGPSTSVYDLQVNHSKIAGNTTGVNNTISSAIDAKKNWWGDASGPSGSGPGTGDPVTSNVLFDPWLTALSGHPAGTCTGVGGTAEMLVDGPISSVSGSEGSGPAAPLYAALAAAAVAAVAMMATGGWYVRRRWLR